MRGLRGGRVESVRPQGNRTPGPDASFFAGAGIAPGGGNERTETGTAEEEDAMPAWSKKDERQYEHIKESALDRGVKEDRAEEVAARTVNKTRREDGRTPNTTTQGTGNPNRGLEERTRDELYNLARERDVEGRSRMNKDELVRALRR